MSSLEISALRGRQILDSRGNPTVECMVQLKGGATGLAAVPSGASTGTLEAVELRDGGDAFDGKGVSTAVAYLNGEIRDRLLGIVADNQSEIDQLLLDQDGTPNKRRVGANTILGASMAVARAAAVALRMPLYSHLGGVSAHLLPVPCLNLLNGGAHAANSVDIQEFMIIPGGFPTYSEALQAGVEIYHALKRVLGGRGLSTNVGDEGGFAPDLPTNRAALEVLAEAVETAGYRLGEEVRLALDVAATEFYEEGAYHLDGKQLDTAGMVDYLAGLAEEFSLVSIEDGMAESDWDGWRLLTQRLGSICQLVGDDIFVTNRDLLRKGIKTGAGNAILIKLNQIGTVTETMQTMQMANRAGFRQMVSHRSGETSDTFIAHLAVATNCGQIKAGAPARGERTAKYNELLRIEQRLGRGARYAGWEGFWGLG